jgi:hydrogenase maturation protein HypF
MTKTLVIGYGNELCGDDGLGWRVAQNLAARELSSDVEVMALRQLNPELAEPISQADRVIFIDARMGMKPGVVSCEPVAPRTFGLNQWSHHRTPQAVLACARDLYGHYPQALSLSITGESFGFSEELSPVVRNAMPQLIEQAVDLITHTQNMAIQPQECPERLHVSITGVVQGVGFRPFIYRQATELGLAGWVSNSTRGVTIEAEGSPGKLRDFLRRIEREKPALAAIQTLEHVFAAPVGYSGFEIRESAVIGDKTALVLPDIATCPDCLREMFDPTNRRYRYPFTNCTHCGPRYSILEALPYDRPNTTMHIFEMCDDCRAEYENPLDRRFHAQPNACPKCGPHLEFWDAKGIIQATHDTALEQAVKAIRHGAIVALKGLGGFQLVVDASDQRAVMRLRERKHREEKPFAVMFPSLQLLVTYCEVSPAEEALLCSPGSPIVLLRRKADSPGSAIASAVAPRNPYLGVMLPYTPLHHLLMAELGFPIVATSGNRSDEPICFDEVEALERLGGIADAFLVHNRPITRHMDDSVVRIVMDKPQILRRARGYAPLPIHVNAPLPPIAATGAHQKNTVAIANGQDIFVSQHIGDLGTAPAVNASRAAMQSLRALYDFNPAAVACDLHLDYASTRAAEAAGVPIIRVQHHYAHVLACMAENQIDAPVLGVAWDGTGYGTDGTIWGGEFLRVNKRSFERIANLRTFRLPGGEKAVKEPRRTAIGVLYELFGDEFLGLDGLDPVASFSWREGEMLRQMLKKGVNSPVTSSAGRLFDGVAALLGLQQISTFEGQAAMELEFACNGASTTESYPFCFVGQAIDWLPAVQCLLADRLNEVPIKMLAAKFHNTLAEIIVAVAKRAGEKQIALTGGCFQNRHLTELTIRRLRSEGFQVYWHQRIPPNDGGIAVGQIVAAARELAGSKQDRE